MNEIDLFHLDDEPRPQIVRAEPSYMVPSTTQFDAIMRVDERGEHWTGRDLMSVADYSKWENFAAVIEKAKAALALVEGAESADHHFLESGSDGGRWGNQRVDDYRLTKFAAYLTAMAADDTKRAVAEARIYFAVRTQEAEMAPRLPDLSDPLAALAYASEQWSQSVALALTERRRAEVAEASVRVLMPAATAWETFCTNGGTLSVSVAAKYLKQRHGVKTGRNLLYALLREWSWVFVRTCEPRGDAIAAGFVEIEDGGSFVPKGSTTKRNAGAKTRLTPAGLLRVAEYYGVTLDVDALATYINDETEETAA